MRKYKQTKRLTVQERLFQIDFWIETTLGVKLPYFSVCEIRKNQRKRFWLWGDLIEYEVPIYVCTHWTYDSRVDAAKIAIAEYLEREKDELEEEVEVRLFCGGDR